MTKIFIAFPFSDHGYEVNQPVLIYRKYNGDGPKGYKSAVTFFCTITNVYKIRINNKSCYSFEEFLKLVGNKTVYKNGELEKYITKEM